MAPEELMLTVGPPANGGSCVARYPSPDGRVVFVRYALPGERVRARVLTERGAYWQAETVEVLEPAAGRIPSLCSIAGVDGAGCCDLAFADPPTARAYKTEVVANQLQRVGGHAWDGVVEELGTSGPTGWRTRIRLDVGADGRPGFHRYHSDELVTDLCCGQLVPGMTDGLPQRFSPGDRVHVVVDDDQVRHVVETGKRRPARVVEGDRYATQRIGGRRWRLPVSAFWQAHRDAARIYGDLVGQWAQLRPGDTAWDLYGGAGVFAASLGTAVGESGRVLSVDTAKAAGYAAREALADLPQVVVRTDSVRRALAGLRRGARRANVAVLDPPRAGAGREVIDLLAAAGVARVVHVGCDAASFARDIGLYVGHGYRVEEIRAFDAFPLTHHVECFALLTR